MNEYNMDHILSVHSHFNSMFYFAHPNIFQFIHVSKNIQIDVYIKTRSPEGGWRNCIIFKEDFAKEKILGKTNCYKFVKSISYKFQIFNQIINLLTINN
jgi:hypothetical protein